MKLLSHPAVTALGLSFLYCLGLMRPLLSSDHIWIHHHSGSPAAIFLPVLFDIAILWGLFTLLLRYTARYRRIGPLVWSCLVLATPWLLPEEGVSHELQTLLQNQWTAAILLSSCFCYLAVVMLGRRSWPMVFEHVRADVNTVLSFVALSSVLAIGQLLWFFWQARDLQASPHLRQAQLATGLSAAKPRVIWILLDELPEEQIFDRRLPGLDLPEFDRIASQSTVFTHVTAAANFTDQAVPSLMTGLPIDQVRGGADGVSLSVHDSATQKWQPFPVQNTIFQDALDQGYHSGIAGWYNPYCRMLPGLLDRCVWTYKQNYNRGVLSEGSIAQNTLNPLIDIASLLLPDHGSRRAIEQQNQAHIDDARELISVADALLEDPSLNFLFLHMPFPHPGGIYDRRTALFKTYGASYLDNLALADRYLAHVRQLLVSRGEWDSTTIIIMGDHSWRTSLVWKATAFWTPEDQAASHGGEFDPRPAYIVKLPHQTSAQRIDRPFAALRTRAMFDGIFNGSIGTPQDLAAFAE